MNEGPALLLMDINCWPIGTEDICFYSSETRNPPTSKDKQCIGVIICFSILKEVINLDCLGYFVFKMTNGTIVINIVLYFIDIKPEPIAGDSIIWKCHSRLFFKII